MAAVALAVVVVGIAAYLSVASLRRDAARQRQADRVLTEVRLELSALDSLAWEGVALGGPDFTVRQSSRLHGRQLRRAAAALSPWLPSEARDTLRRAVPVYLGSVDAVEAALDRRQADRAMRIAQLRVSGTSQLLGAELDRAAKELQRRALELDRRAVRGTQIIVGAAGSLSLLMLTLTAIITVRAERRRRRTLTLFRSLVQKSTDAVVVIDEQRQVRYATQAVHVILGRPPDILVGTEVTALVADDQRHAAEAALERVLAGSGTGEPTHWRLQHAAGSTVEAEVVATDLRDDPAVGAIVLNLRDVTERQRLAEELRHQAFHDSLTGLANRALFEDRLGGALSRRRRGRGGVGVILVDLDDFKAVNDQRGHSAGDELLRDVARCLDDMCRAGDTAARLGGDEFALLLDGADGVDEVRAVAERAVGALASLPAVRCSVSVGAVIAADDTATVESVLRDADIALYAAKADGKGRVSVFQGELLERARKHTQLRHDLSRAAESGRLEVHYQPIVALPDGDLTGLEALLRWRHPDLGLVSPGEFIPLAEETGDIVALGRFVLRRVCRDLAEWRAQGLGAGIPVSVNVSAQQIARESFVEEVLRELACHDLDPQHLVVELTESALVRDLARAGEQIGALRAAGVRVAVDDFGTGYSSLSYLRELELDSVKIDRSFVARVDERPEDAVLVRSVIELGHALGVSMVAEGIERDAQLDVLCDIGCEQGQGFLFARPQPEGETRALLAGGDAGWLLPAR
jgi:diguanylate cyclase (GGDEF)-like protein/PAS domain S-box-containing protein